MFPKCLVKVTFTNLKGPLSKTFKILKVSFRTVTDVLLCVCYVTQICHRNVGESLHLTYMTRTKCDQMGYNYDVTAMLYIRSWALSEIWSRDLPL